MTEAERRSTAELIELVQKTRQKVKEAAVDLETLTSELRKRLEEDSD